MTLWVSKFRRTCGWETVLTISSTKFTQVYFVFALDSLSSFTSLHFTSLHCKFWKTVLDTTIYTSYAIKIYFKGHPALN